MSTPSPDYSPATYTPTTHCDGWGVFAPRWIIVHGTAGFTTAQQVADFFVDNTPPTSTHYVVGRDGAVVQCVRETSAAWGNGGISGPAGASSYTAHTGQHDAWWDSVPDHNPNTATFSIEHVKPTDDNSDLITPAQQAASFALIKHLCDAHGIPARAADASGGVTGHFSMDPVNRSDCPGPYPWDALWAYLQGGGMTTLPNFPMKDQRTERTSDGHPPENGSWDCVPTSFAAAIQYFDGGYISGDELKDAEYGETYTGGTALVAYVDQSGDRARSVYHITADPENSSDPAALVRFIHAGVQAGCPVIATIPSQWGIPRDQQPAGYTTHVICFYSEGPGALTAMNPWGGFAHSGSDQYWADRLCYNQVWRIHKEDTPLPAGSPTGFYGLVTTDDPEVWLCNLPGNGHHLGHGFRKHYVTLASSAFGCGATQILGLPLSEEYKQSDGTIRQDFERGALIYDASKANPWMIYHAAVGAELASLKHQVESDQSNIQALTAQTVKDASAIGALNKQVSDLQAQLAAAQAAAGKAPALQAIIAQAQADLAKAASV